MTTQPSLFTTEEIQQIISEMDSNIYSDYIRSLAATLSLASAGDKQKLLKTFQSEFSGFLQFAKLRLNETATDNNDIKSQDYIVLKPYSSTVFSELRKDEQDELIAGFRQDYGEGYNDETTRELTENDFNDIASWVKNL